MRGRHNHDRRRQTPERFPWPPLIYVAAIAISIALWLALSAAVVRLAAVRHLLRRRLDRVVAAVAHRLTAMRTHEPRQDHDQSEQVPATIWSPQARSAFTRNPIYLANTLLMIGVALISGIAWFLPLAVIAAFVTQKLAIEGEEKVLEARFGKKYRDYEKRVRRWI